MENTTSDMKIAQALELLNEAAREKKDEVQAILKDKYSHLKQAIAEGAEQSKVIIEKAQQFAREGKEKIKEGAMEADKRVRENPWPYIGGAAAVGLFIGFLMGSNRK